MGGLRNRTERSTSSEAPGPAVGAGASNPDEPCVGCGDATVVGSVRYFDRHDVVQDDGSRVYLCDECYAKARAAKGGEPLTEADMRVIASNGLVMGVAFFRGGGGGS